MPERLKPPFKIKTSGEAYWIEDAEGYRFGFTYFRDRPIVGTDRSGKVSKELARRIVRWIARQMTDAAKDS